MNRIEKIARKEVPFVMATEGWAERQGFVNGFKYAISDIIKFIEEGEGCDIISGYGERCELINALKRFYYTDLASD